jgi:hypothetical protein
MKNKLTDKQISLITTVINGGGFTHLEQFGGTLTTDYGTLQMTEDNYFMIKLTGQKGWSVIDYNFNLIEEISEEEFESYL